MTASHASSYSLVVYVFYKILQLLFWLNAFLDVLRNRKLCKLAKVSYDSTNYFVCLL